MSDKQILAFVNRNDGFEVTGFVRQCRLMELVDQGKIDEDRAAAFACEHGIGEADPANDELVVSW